MPLNTWEPRFSLGASGTISEKIIRAGACPLRGLRPICAEPCGGGDNWGIWGPPHTHTARSPWVTPLGWGDTGGGGPLLGHPVEVGPSGDGGGHGWGMGVLGTVPRGASIGAWGWGWSPLRHGKGGMLGTDPRGFPIRPWGQGGTGDSPRGVSPLGHGVGDSPWGGGSIGAWGQGGVGDSPQGGPRWAMGLGTVPIEA